MIKTFRKIMLVFVVFTLLFIWGNSMMPGDISTEESDWVMQLVQPVLDFVHSGRIQVWLTRLADHLPERIQSFSYRAIGWLDRHVLTRDSSFLVRKAAHLSEYMLLGFFMGFLFAHSDGRGRVFLPEGACLAAALVDEGIQLFSIQRAAQLRDVCIDMLGAIAGLTAALILLSILRLIVRVRAKKRKRTPKTGNFS